MHTSTLTEDPMHDPEILSSPIAPLHMSEAEQFQALQKTFVQQYQKVFSDLNGAKTVIIVPSLTLDEEILQKVRGAHFYEERMLCMLMLLKMPQTHIIYLTSLPIDPVVIDYYLHLLPGITGYHASRRLTLLSCYDASKKSLTEKILQRPRLIEKIKKSIPYGHHVHISCFNVTAAERRLAIKLNAPIYGCDPELLYLGTKSNGRKVFRDCGVNLPDGVEDLSTEEDIISALVFLKQQHPGLKAAVVKINDGFSGEGNAIFPFDDADENNLQEWISEVIPHRLKIVAEYVTYADTSESSMPWAELQRCLYTVPALEHPLYSAV